jgi:hypothetical protein
MDIKPKKKTCPGGKEQAVTGVMGEVIDLT